MDKLSELLSKEFSRIDIIQKLSVSALPFVFFRNTMPIWGREDSFDCRAVLRVHHQDYDAAHQLIEVTRDMLDTELTALSSESYQRAYPIMVQVYQNLDFFTLKIIVVDNSSFWWKLAAMLG
jgi:hypothetical protein